jgi:hypothetical protein
MNARFFHSGPLLAALSCLLLIAGCSALRIVYSQADHILAWRADDYFDFDPHQKQEFNARIERLLEWHRRDQLPEYANFVNTAVGKARPGLGREDVVWFIEGFKARYRVIVNRGIPDAAELLATLQPEQLAVLQKRWDKDNRKFVAERELDGGIEKRKRARLKRTLAQITDWTGSLTREQEHRIEALLDRVPLSEHLRHQDRIRRQQEFLELLKLRANAAEFRPRLQAWLLDWEQGRAPEYARLSNEALEQRIQFYLAVEKVLTPTQREHALQRLQKFGDDFRALSAKALKAGVAPFETASLAFF